MPNKRSLPSLQRRAVRNYLLTVGFRDRTRAETICTVTPEQIQAHLTHKFPNQPVYVVYTRVEKGEVLVDSRGHGSLQNETEVKTR